MLAEKFVCPCCGYKTFSEEVNGQYEICEVCFWEDDPIQLKNPDYVGGANRVSLRQAQKNFVEFGASEKEMVKNVRAPKINEERSDNWKVLE
jgi:Cysteine-rich CPCC